MTAIEIFQLIGFGIICTVLFLAVHRLSKPPFERDSKNSR